jgi:hypothetical protein
MPIGPEPNASTSSYVHESLGPNLTPAGELASKRPKELTGTPAEALRVIIWRNLQHRLSEGGPMGFDQYHEPPEELPPATRTFARLCASLTEEAEAIGWYEQRLAVEPDPVAQEIMRDAQGEEFKHFSMDLEFLLRRTPIWREIAEGVLFQPGDIVEHGEEAEAETIEGGGSGGGPSDEDRAGSLGIGGLRGADR